MSAFEDFKDLLGGSGKKPLPLVMADGEVEVTRSVASFRPGGLTSVGGELVLTNRRLVFTPLNVTAVVKVLTWALGKAGVPDVIADVPAKVGGLIEQKDVATVAGIAGVAVGRQPQLFRPPTLVVTGTDGSVSEIGVLVSRGAPSISSRNSVERDRMVAAVRAAMRGE